MIVIDWVFLMGFLATARYVGGWVAWDCAGGAKRLDGSDIGTGVLMGFLAGMLWPIVVPIMATIYAVRKLKAQDTFVKVFLPKPRSKTHV